ncbi:Uncharacterized protein Fot_19331 [Forsythia ovata]|uniref:Uncharacterized protein n=1 Tax=Forsythia ovata TaxID=205694 RepID=A0ABD1VKR6_9LAMI
MRAKRTKRVDVEVFGPRRSENCQGFEFGKLHFLPYTFCPSKNGQWAGFAFAFVCEDDAAILDVVWGRTDWLVIVDLPVDDHITGAPHSRRSVSHRNLLGLCAQMGVAQNIACGTLCYV